MHNYGLVGRITIILLLSTFLTIDSSIYSQSPNDSLNNVINVDYIDTLESIRIIGVEISVVKDFINITKSIKHYKYNKFQANYSITYNRNNKSDSVSFFGSTTFVSTPQRPANYYYPLVEDVDSTATHLSAWNIHLGGRAIYYAEMPCKLFLSAQRNRILLLHIKKENGRIHFTIIDRRKPHDKTTIIYDNDIKKITQITQTMHNTSYLDFCFDSVETIINVSNKGSMIIPTEISTILKKANQTIEIFNYNLKYSSVTPKEYKHLVKIGVYKR